MRMDLCMWEQFLSHQSVYCRPFTDFSETTDAEELDFFTDSSRNFELGCGGVYGKQWFFSGWDPLFMKKAQPSIAYHELYAVAVGIYLWLHKFKNRTIILFCDNQGAVQMINQSTSNCKNCMVLIRLIVLESLKCNTVVCASDQS